MAVIWLSVATLDVCLAFEHLSSCPHLAAVVCVWVAIPQFLVGGHEYSLLPPLGAVVAELGVAVGTTSFGFDMGLAPVVAFGTVAAAVVVVVAFGTVVVVVVVVAAAAAAAVALGTPAAVVAGAAAQAPAAFALASVVPAVSTLLPAAGFGYPEVSAPPEGAFVLGHGALVPAGCAASAAPNAAPATVVVRGVGTDVAAPTSVVHAGALLPLLLVFAFVFVAQGQVVAVAVAVAVAVHMLGFDFGFGIVGSEYSQVLV